VKLCIKKVGEAGLTVRGLDVLTVGKKEKFETRNSKLETNSKKKSNKKEEQTSLISLFF